MNLTQLTSQIILMFILMLVGLLVNKLGFMHAQTSTDLTNILLYIVSPCLIIQAFEKDIFSRPLANVSPGHCWNCDHLCAHDHCDTITIQTRL